MKPPRRIMLFGLLLCAFLLLINLPAVAGLVGYYNFDADARDGSSSSNDGIIVGAQIVPEGKTGGACEFDGVDDYIVVPHQDFLASPQFTVSAWLKSREPVVGLERGPFGKHREHDNVSYYWIYQRTNELWSTMVGSSYGLFRDVTTSVSAVAGVWGMVTLTHDGSMMRMYVNGALVGQNTVSGYAGNSYDFLIGAGEWSAFSGSPQRWWNGWIDEFRIYDQALSDAEVMALYLGDTTFTTAVGSIRCVLGPQGALDAGAAWRLSSDSLETWRLSGSAVTNLPFGTYEIIFKEAGEYVRPQNRQVSVQSTGTCEVAVTYPQDPHNGLVLHYNFDQAPGSYVQDLSGLNNSGLVVGAVQSASGHSGFAYEFNGSSDYIRVRNAPSLMSTQFTAMAWAKSREPIVSIERGILGKHREHDNITYYWLYQLRATNILRGTMVGDSFGAFRDVDSSATPFSNQWGSVALTYDGSTMRLYVNCVLVDQEAVTGYRGNAYDLLIGAGEFMCSNPSCPQRWWNGWIDDVRIYRRALSSEEISLLCDGETNEPPACGSLTCSLVPQGVADSGGRWRLSSESPQTGHASGYTISNLIVGTYNVIFKDVIGWVPPSPVQIAVAKDQNTNVVGVYAYASTNRLVLYYPCDDAPISPVVDHSGYGNHGTASNVLFDAAGYSNGCYAFNGTNSFITAPDDASYDTLQFTISMWAKSREPIVDIERGILGKHREHDNYTYYWVYQLRGTNLLRGTMVGDQYNNFRDVDADSTPLIGAWAMVTLTYNGTNMAFYVNGDLMDTNTAQNYRGNAYSLLVGAGEWTMSGGSPQRWWNGWIDEVKIYSYAMDGDEVRALYEGNASVDVIPPQILKIAPPDRHVTTAAHVNMNIFAEDNVGVTEVTVNGNPASVIGSGIWHYRQDGLDNSANHFSVVVRDAVGNSTTQEVVYFRGQHLKLTAMWDGYWRVRNHNTFDVPYTWDVYQTSECGTGTVMASSDDFFETSTGPKTVRLFVDGIQQDVKAWDPSPKMQMGQAGLEGGSPPIGSPRTSNPAPLADEPCGTISWQSVSSQVYRVLCSTDLMDGAWADLVPPAVYTGDGALILHTNELPLGRNIFYMLEVSNIATNL